MLDLTFKRRQVGHRPQLRLSVVESRIVEAQAIDGAFVQSPRGACNILVVRKLDVRAPFVQALGGMTQRRGNHVIAQRRQRGLRRLALAPDGVDQLRRPTSAAS
jgi:hypothetical protein